VLVSGVDRPNIALVRLHESDARCRAQIVAALLAKISGRAMIFVPTTREGVKVQAAMASVGCELPLFHSKLDGLERDGIQARFSGRIDPPINAIITTSAFSMGVDIPDVRLVVHWQHPASVEDYLQEFGRAGRDGKPALALLFTTGERDTGLLKYMAEKTAEEAVASGKRSSADVQATLAGRVRRIREMQRLSESDRCFRAALLDVLQGPRHRQRRSLAQWLLDFVFSSRTRVEDAGACCDYCHPVLGQRIRAGTYVPGDKLDRWWAIGWRRLWRRLWVSLALLLVLAVVWGTFLDQRRAASPEPAATVYRAYVASHYPGQSFTTPRVRTYRGYDIACASPRFRGASMLCLLIRADHDGVRAVSGTYRRDRNRHFACTGAARRLRIC
jgi:hypothetical protein